MTNKPNSLEVMIDRVFRHPEARDLILDLLAEKGVDLSDTDREFHEATLEEINKLVYFSDVIEARIEIDETDDDETAETDDDETDETDDDETDETDCEDVYNPLVRFYTEHEEATITSVRIRVFRYQYQISLNLSSRYVLWHLHRTYCT